MRTLNITLITIQQICFLQGLPLNTHMTEACITHKANRTFVWECGITFKYCDSLGGISLSRRIKGHMIIRHFSNKQNVTGSALSV